MTGTGSAGLQAKITYSGDRVVSRELLLFSKLQLLLSLLTAASGRNAGQKVFLLYQLNVVKNGGILGSDVSKNIQGLIYEGEILQGKTVSLYS